MLSQVCAGQVLSLLSTFQNFFFERYTFSKKKSTAANVFRKKEMKRKDYNFRRQFNEKPSIIPGCPGIERC